MVRNAELNIAWPTLVRKNQLWRMQNPHIQLMECMNTKIFIPGKHQVLFLWPKFWISGELVDQRNPKERRETLIKCLNVCSRNNSINCNWTGVKAMKNPITAFSQSYALFSVEIDTSPTWTLNRDGVRFHQASVKFHSYDRNYISSLLR